MFKVIKTAEEVKQEKLQKEYKQALNKWKQERQKAVDSIIVEHKGKEFQGNEVSQDRIARAILSLSDEDTINWVASDNTEVELTKADLQAILTQAREQQSLIWNKDRPVKPE
jgi:succinate dehydrogenase flavin-adding protein (antitoxin of CptAB toxin-antitoxin module)